MPIPNLDRVFAARFHGAVNIRGIRYQVLYSLLRAFDLYAPNSEGSSIRLEGIEDVDLLGFSQGDQYVQVKTSQTSWNWAKLKAPIANFLEVHRIAPDTRFSLAVDFELKTDIARLYQFTSLPPSEQTRVRNKFRKLCKQVGGKTTEADGILSKLEIASFSEEQVWSELRRKCTEAFALGSEAVDTYLLALVARFLEWAEDRETVTRSKLNEVRMNIGEALSRESEFQAYGRGLISRVNWDQEEDIDDFLAGKTTRPGHIAAGADIKRVKWLQTIARAIASAGICIVRSSSGQGKSALLYRYAFDKWPAEQTLVLRNAETVEQVELVRNYLRFRASMGIPLLLLIDNASRHTRLWPLIAQECASLKVDVLVTVRTEDWYRFALQSLTNYEIIEPDLEREEAQALFVRLRAEGKVDPSVDSADWAYERIGQPHLLLEFTYLVTHGEMLEDRLRDQIQQFSVHGEDPAKIELLRRATLADSFGAPLTAETLLGDLSLRDDPQQVLRSLEGEYIHLEGGRITGLHWVRSDHLARLLHEGFPSRSTTALAVLDAVPYEYVASFVAAAIRDADANPSAIIVGLSSKSLNVSMATFLTYLDGLFEGGEHRFFSANRSLFEQAYSEIGTPGPLLLMTAFMPVVKLDTLDKMGRIQGDQGANFRRLTEIAGQATTIPRGLDFVTQLLGNIAPKLSPENLSLASGELGRLLDWCALCQITLPAWSVGRDACVANGNLLQLPIEVFCAFAQGVWRFDGPTYMKWFQEHQHDLTGFLLLHTDSLTLSVEGDVASIEYFVASEADSPHEQTMQRLRILRAALPFCESYRCKGLWCMPFGLVPTVDETEKNIPRDNLPFESDVSKNVVWKMAVEAGFLPDSYYRFQEAWFNLRQSALQFVQVLSSGLQMTLAGKAFDFHAAIEKGALLVRVNELINRIPDPPPQTSPALAKILKDAPKRWHTSFSNYFRQIFEYLQAPQDNHNSGRLAVFNCKDACSRLPKMHAAFSELFGEVPDYFEMTSLVPEEIESHSELADILEAWVLDPTKRYSNAPLESIRKEATRKRHEQLQRIKGSLRPLVQKGIDVILPGDIYVEHPLRHVILAFSVSDPSQPEHELSDILQSLVQVKDVVDFFCLIPLYQGATFLEGGYRFSTSQLSELGQGSEPNWEAFTLTTIPIELLSALPTFPVHHSVRVRLRSLGLGIIGAVTTLRGRHNQIAILEASATDFERELYLRHMRQLKLDEMKVAAVASELLVELNRNLPQGHQECFLAVSTFLQNVSNVLSERGVVELKDGFEEKAVEFIRNLDKVLDHVQETFQK